MCNAHCALCRDFIPRCGLIICSILSLLGWILILVSPSLHGILALYFGEYKIQLKMNTLQPTSPKLYQISSRTRSFPHWLRIRLLFTPHEHLCHWGKFQWFIINVIKSRFRLDVILNFFLNKPLGKGQIILMIIQIHQKVILIQVAGSGNKGIVTSVFNCQLTAGILFINMVVNGELLQS